MGVANDPTVLRTRRLLKLSGQMGTLFTACLHGKHPLSLLFSLAGFFFSPEAPSNMAFVLHKSFTSLPFGLATCEGLWLAASGTTGMQMG